MIEDICRVETNLKAPGFGNLKRLTQRCVEGPSSRQFDRLPPDSASMSGLRILKKDLAGLFTGDRLQVAVLLERRRHLVTLRILDPTKGPAFEVAANERATRTLIAPMNASLAQTK